MHINLVLLFKSTLYSSTLVIKYSKVRSIKLFLRQDFYCKAIGQSSFISSATRMAHPL